MLCSNGCCSSYHGLMIGRLFPGFWIHTPHPFLVRFSENFGIRYYGLAYLAGFVAAGWLLHRYHQRQRSPLDLAAIFDLMTVLIAGVVIGGRLGYFVLYQSESFFHDPLVLFRVWEGGMASHGGFVGVVVAMWWYARSRPVSFWQVSDLVVTVAPPGLFIVRIANFLNGELWGKPTTVAWAMIFSNSGGGPIPRHPSQLYEATLEGMALFAYLQWRFWKSDAIEQQPGRIAGEFLVAYALARSVAETFREPDASLILGLSRGTFYSLFMFASGAVIIGLATSGRLKRKT